MMRNLLTLAVVAGLIYGAYMVNDKFFTKAPLSAAAKQKAEAIPETMVSFVCPEAIEVFDPASPDKTLGYFTKGTEIKVGGESGIPGMKPVAYQPPTGQVIRAVCKISDLTAATTSVSASTPNTAPLDKKLSISGKQSGVSTWLGNGQMTISQGCGGGSCASGSSSTIKMGSSGNVKSLSSSFGNSATPAPVSPSTPKSPEQGIKEKAKDLQNPQTQ